MGGGGGGGKGGYWYNYTTADDLCAGGLYLIDCEAVRSVIRKFIISDNGELLYQHTNKLIDGNLQCINLHTYSCSRDMEPFCDSCSATPH